MKKRRMRWRRKRARRAKHTADVQARDRDYAFAIGQGNVLKPGYRDSGVRGPGAQRKNPKTRIWGWL